MRGSHRASSHSVISAGPPKNKCSRIQVFITSKAAAVIFWVLTIAHCAIYMLGPGMFRQLLNFVIWARWLISTRLVVLIEDLLREVWVTGGPLAIMTVTEVAVRVSAQGGPLWRWRSWRKVMIPLYHQLEALVLALMAYRGGMSIYLLKVALEAQGDLPAMVSDQDKATVLVLCAYRALRTYGDLHGVSVHQTLQQRRLRAKLNKLWMDEYQQKLQEHRARLVVKLQRMVDRKVPQLLFLLASLLYCGAEVFDFVRTSQVLGYVLLMAFGCEFLIRTKAQGGEIFFRPLFNKLEFFVLTAGTWCLFYASWYTQYLASSKAEATAVAAATAALLLLHRCIRLLGIQLKVSASEFDADSVMSAKAMQIFMAKFGTLVDVPPTNVKVDLPGSMIHIQKASLKPEAFAQLHLPVTVTGGLIEDLFIDFFSSDTTKDLGRPLTFAPRVRGRTKIRIKNMLLLFGPGPGLAEAGEGEPGSYWQYDSVRAAKSRVIDLICQRLTVPFPTAADPAVVSADSLGSRPRKTFRQMGQNLIKGARYKVGTAVAQGFRRLRMALQDSSVRHVDMNVHNVMVQFEDHEGLLGHGCLTLGFKVDCVKLHRHQGRHFSAQMTRWSVYAEPYAAADASRRSSMSGWKPNRTVKKMVRLTCAERFRSWAFAKMEDDHPPDPLALMKRIERFPERHNILTVQQVVVRGSPAETHQAEEPIKKPSTESRLLAPLRAVLRKDDPSASASRAVDIESQLFGSDSSQVDAWEWTIKVRPMRVIVDDMQFRCLRYVRRCVANWWAWDTAFQWYPDLRPCDPEVRRASPAERSVVVRFWWVYAAHRALVSLGRRPNFIYLNLVRKASYRHKHRSLITEVLERSRPLIPGARLALKASAHQRQQLSELQIHLPYPDILTCFREELGKCAMRGWAARPAAMAATDGPLPERDEELDSVVEDSDSDVSEGSVPGDLSGDEDQPEAEPSLGGHWELRWTALEVFVLGWRSNVSRPILLHSKLREICLEADVRNQEASASSASPGSSARLTPFGLICTLKDLSIQSPHSAAAFPVAGDVLRVLRPVRMLPAWVIPNYRWLGVSRMGQSYACLLQASPNSAKELHWL
ncbi:hypothetical protein AK812_SmicGene21847 [Symbiodinium microadriaticum]|uniref:Uncharacterized protein n=1 Tax=Symbiodinium microadriaticum TaxID=2951 RepID=A0A1Q9DLB1_SYMMI|nr:hypothetical protein AK812_SmicGene21847 [Symbiodinium microadriaticum]